jgi:ABC-type uncharacterized transport system substrate-binding protein
MLDTTRRHFITLLGGTAAAWPLAARAQQTGGSARIGFLRASAPPDHTMAALRRGLAEHGYVEGKNLTLVPSWGDGNLDRLAELAEALVAARVELILTDGTGTARAARAATTIIPIVMAGGNDPVQGGLAAGLSRPGGNVTGFTTQASAQRKLIVARAVEHRLPTMYETRDFVELGGLVSYGADFTDLFRLAAGYIVKILNGAKAGDLPIEQATKFELVINLATAKKLGLTVPPVMLGRADEVIE